MIFGFNFKVFVQLAIYFMIRGCLEEFISIVEHVLRAISEGRRFLLPVNEEAVSALLEEGARFWRREPVSGGGSPFLEGARFWREPFLEEEVVSAFLEEGAVSGGGSRFWRGEPFLEGGAVSGGGSRFWRRKPFIEYGVRR
jgi:hypothetical protein